MRPGTLLCWFCTKLSKLLNFEKVAIVTEQDARERVLVTRLHVVEQCLHRAMKLVQAMRLVAETVPNHVHSTAARTAQAEYDAAEAELLLVRAELESHRATKRAEGIGQDPEPPPIVVTPRLLFARWLVQTGRLHDQ